MILEDKVGFKLCIVPTTCYVVVILDGQGGGECSQILVRFWVDFQLNTTEYLLNLIY